MCKNFLANDEVIKPFLAKSLEENKRKMVKTTAINKKVNSFILKT